MNWYKKYSQLKPPGQTLSPGQQLGVYLVEALKGPINPQQLHSSLDGFITDQSRLDMMIQEAMTYQYAFTKHNNLNVAQQAVIHEVLSVLGNQPMQPVQENQQDLQNTGGVNV